MSWSPRSSSQLDTRDALDPRKERINSGIDAAVTAIVYGACGGAGGGSRYESFLFVVLNAEGAAAVAIAAVLGEQGASRDHLQAAVATIGNRVVMSLDLAGASWRGHRNVDLAFDAIAEGARRIGIAEADNSAVGRLVDEHLRRNLAWRHMVHR